jgi:putative hydrolase of the HAD superfamily
VKAVLFDFGGVITGPLEPMFVAVAETAGCEPAELAAFLFASYDSDVDGENLWSRVERGEMPFADLCAWAEEEGRRRGWTIDLRRMVDFLGGIELRTAVLDRIADLRRRGYRTAVVSNNFKEFDAFWRHRLDLDVLFDTVVSSWEVGVRKPEAAIYRVTLERLGGIVPEEAVLLDDFEVNLAGARAIGLHGILVGREAGPALAALETLLAGNP